MQISQTLILIGLVTLAACGDIGLSAGPAGTTEGTTAGTTAAGNTTNGTTSGTTTSGTSGTSGTTGTTTNGTTTSGTTTSSACTTSTETYANFGQSFISTNCIACHGSGASPDLTSLANIQAIQSTVLQQITSGSMPPAGPLDATDATNVEAWLNCNPLP